MARRPHPIQRLERVLERLRDEVETEVGAGVAESGMLLSGIEIDILDRGDEIAVIANVPGCRTDDIDVRADDGMLSIEARPHGVEPADPEGEEPDEGDGGGDGGAGGSDGDVEVLRRERPDRELRRTVRLPAPVVADEATASCDDGVLGVVLPKATDGSDETTIDVQ